MDKETLRRIERLEERLNQIEKDVSTLSALLISLKDEVEKNRVDMRERVIDLKTDINEDIDDITVTLGILSNNVTTVTESLQNLYTSHEGSTVKVKTNEKVIWTVITVIGTIGLVLLQSYLKTEGG